jgi:hypothetical protein
MRGVSRAVNGLDDSPSILSLELSGPDSSPDRGSLLTESYAIRR